MKNAEDRESFLQCMDFEIQAIVNLFTNFGLLQEEDDVGLAPGGGERWLRWRALRQAHLTLPVTRQRDVCHPLICVKELFEASKSMVAATFVNRMLRAYPDVTLNHLEDLMSLRDDVKSKEVGWHWRGQENVGAKERVFVLC